jgi:hypothetical protein
MSMVLVACAVGACLVHDYVVVPGDEVRAWRQTMRRTEVFDGGTLIIRWTMLRTHPSTTERFNPVRTVQNPLNRAHVFVQAGFSRSDDSDQLETARAGWRRDTPRSEQSRRFANAVTTVLPEDNASESERVARLFAEGIESHDANQFYWYSGDPDRMYAWVYGPARQAGFDIAAPSNLRRRGYTLAAQFVFLGLMLVAVYLRWRR